jgi:hypothetical protein
MMGSVAPVGGVVVQVEGYVWTRRWWLAAAGEDGGRQGKAGGGGGSGGSGGGDYLSMVFFTRSRDTFRCIDLVLASSSVNFARIIASRTVTPGAQIRMRPAAFALSGSARLVRGMMGQQLPVGLYRSASVDGGDMVEGQCLWMNLLFRGGTRGGQKDGVQNKLLTIKIEHLHTNGIVCSRWN